MKIYGAVISDIHFGIMDDLKLVNQLDTVFLETLRNMDKLDFIVVDGDWYDRKLYLNNRTSDVSFSTMSNIVEIAKDKNAKVRIIYGTESHESDQYNIFKVYELDNDIDFRIIYSVEEEELFPDFNVLYIPEEVMTNKREFYKEYLLNNDKYNYIFGHGVIQEVMTNAVKHMVSKDSTRVKVPVFTTSELNSICKGQTYFGHYHIMTNYKDRVFYVGSFTRWQFGEETPKGFFITEYDKADDSYSQTFIENYLAETYKTYYYGYDSDIFISQDNFINELDRIDTLNDANMFDYARLMINIPEDHPSPQFIIDYLKERYDFNSNIKVSVVNGYISKKQKITKEQIKNVVDRYSYIFDKSVSLEHKIMKYIKTKYERNISVDMVKTILYGNIIYDTTGDDNDESSNELKNITE